MSRSHDLSSLNLSAFIEVKVSRSLPCKLLVIAHPLRRLLCFENIYFYASAAAHRTLFGEEYFSE